MFSNTLMRVKMFVTWNDRESPRRLISYGVRSVTSSPLTRMRPVVTGYLPVIRLKSVDLPAPFGPINAWRVPASRTRLTPRMIGVAPNDLRTSTSSIAAVVLTGSPRLRQRLARPAASQARLACGSGSHGHHPARVGEGGGGARRRPAQAEPAGDHERGEAEPRRRRARRDGDPEEPSRRARRIGGDDEVDHLEDPDDADGGDEREGGGDQIRPDEAADPPRAPRRRVQHEQARQAHRHEQHGGQEEDAEVEEPHARVVAEHALQEREHDGAED